MKMYKILTEMADYCWASGGGGGGGLNGEVEGTLSSIISSLIVLARCLCLDIIVRVRQLSLQPQFMHWPCKTNIDKYTYNILFHTCRRSFLTIYPFFAYLARFKGTRFNVQPCSTSIFKHYKQTDFCNDVHYLQ